MTNPIQISKRAQGLTSSAIREILKVTERPEVISFAGGLPSPATFPVERMRWACDQGAGRSPAGRAAIRPDRGLHAAARMGRRTPEPERRHHPPQPGADHHRLAAGPGPAGQGADRRRQQGAGGNPELPGRAAGVLAVPAGVLGHADRRAGHRHRRIDRRQLAGARFMYCLPNFQNPTGRRMPLERRKALLESHRRRRAGDRGRPLRRALLQRRRAAQPAVDEAGRRDLHGFVLQGAGARACAWASWSRREELHGKLVQAKQAADLHTPSFTQRIVL